METEYKFEGTLTCKRCGRDFDWYCINLHLLPRTRDLTPFTVPNGALMSINRYEIDGTPVFKGGCTYCNFTNQLPREIVDSIPKEIYSHD